jgi:hypothetical protein
VHDDVSEAIARRLVPARGAPTSHEALEQITASSHGADYTVDQPSEMARAFFDAVARRILHAQLPGWLAVALGEERGQASPQAVTGEWSNHQNDRIEPKLSETATIPVNRLAAMRVILNEARRERGAGPHHFPSGLRPAG